MQKNHTGFFVTTVCMCALIIGPMMAHAKPSGGGGGGRVSAPSRTAPSQTGGWSAPTTKNTQTNNAQGTFNATKSAGQNHFGQATTNNNTGGWSAGKNSAQPAVTPGVTKSVDTKPVETKPGGGWNVLGKSNANTAPSDAASAAKTKSLNAEKSRQAMADYKAQREKLVAPSTPVTVTPEMKRTVVDRGLPPNYRFNPEERAHRTNTFYQERGWTAPTYMNSGGFAPSYGIFEVVSLAYMVDHIMEPDYAKMALANQNSKEMKEWRQKMDEAAKTNDELKAKLAVMDQQVQKLQQEGVKVDPNFIPEEMKEIAISDDVLKAVAPPEKEKGWPWGWIALGTLGVAGGAYLVFGRKYSVS